VIKIESQDLHLIFSQSSSFVTQHKSAEVAIGRRDGQLFVCARHEAWTKKGWLVSEVTAILTSALSLYGRMLLSQNIAD